MNILLAGASGFIGSHLKNHLEAKGYIVKTLVRKKKQISKNKFFWNPSAGEIDKTAFNNTDVVINLAGKSIFGLWTKKRKKEILESRVNATKLLADTIKQSNSKPKVFISASATGYYGNDIEANEETPVGDTFLAKVCEAWEEETLALANVRTIQLRLGVVVHPSGGMLREVLRSIKAKLIFNLDSGEHYLSYINLEDVLAIFEFLIEKKDIVGSVNATSPEPILYKDFIQGIADKHNAFVINIPKSLLTFFAGKEFAENMLFANQKVLPSKLLTTGFNFKNS